MVEKAVDTRKVSPRQRLLAAADELFYSEGVHVVGIDRLIEKAGVAKGSLYYNFRGKDELITVYLLGRHAAWTTRIDGALTGTQDPGEKILIVFDVLETLFSEPGYRGCSFMNAVAEARVGGPELRAAANFRTWLHELFGHLVAALDVPNSQELTDQLVILYDGAVTSAQMDNSPKAATTAKTLAAMVVEFSRFENRVA